MTRRHFFLLALYCLPLLSIAQQANYAAAEKYDEPALRKQVGSLTIVPFWFKGGDQCWFVYEDGKGRNFYYVDPQKKKKDMLFDKPLIESRLAALRKEPIEAAAINYSPPFSISARKQTVAVTYKGKTYAYDFYKHTLEEGNAGKDNAAYFPKGVYGTASPDKAWQLFTLGHNLYLNKVGDTSSIALSKDATTYYSFGINEGDTGRFQRLAAEAVWLPDSKRFYALRKDNRRVGTMSVYHTLAAHPWLETYKYQLPGDKEVTQYELFAGDVSTGKLVKMQAEKWKDQELSVVKTDQLTQELFFLRKKRTCDEIELCAGNMATGAVRVVIHETSKPYINDDLFNVSIIHGGEEIIWWSDRTGWGQYYLYDATGKLKTALTEGAWTAGRIVRIDTNQHCLYFYGYGKEKGRNPYYAHLYKASLQGGPIQLLTPEDASHAVFLSPSGQYFIDNYSRIDQAPLTILRNTKGAYIMEVAKAELKKLFDYGWQPAEPFTVKAADGVTDLYGIMWKPFDFDPAKRYPIISQVYPGPQTETVWTDFTVFDKYNNAPLAQLGFIVVCMGHRGGSPYRNKAYASYQYGNLRDAPLADDRYGIQQLARRFSFIDSNRVGIFGHSGGGMMATAAICTYPDFYKVAVASSANHDNTIYNRAWGEGYQGIQERSDTTGSPNGESAFRFSTAVNQALARNLKGHLLLVTGETDANVHPGHTYRMADALVKAGKDFDMLVLPGQSHHYEGPYKVFFEKKLRNYFVQYLMGAPTHAQP